MSAAHDPGRRRLLVILGSGAAAAAAVPVGASLLAPVAVDTVSGGDDFLDILGVDEILEGEPLRVTLKADRQDAWTTFRNVELGSAWLLKGADGTVTAYASACPHLGCAVDWKKADGRFECPCHDGVFAKDGSVVSGPSPRALDRLQAKVENGRILVRFRRVGA